MMRIVKIDRGHIEIEMEGNRLSLSGEAMLQKPLPAMSEYVVYQNSIHWQNKAVHAVINTKELFEFLEKEFLRRNMILIIE